MAQVLVQGLHKSYGSTEVVHGIDIAIADGEFVALVGPSGCGKSTLLRMVSGLEEISGGRIIIGNRVVNNLPPKDRDIAMVFQNYALYPHMKVRDNLSFALSLQKVDKSEIDTRVNNAAEILGLGPFLERYPRELSGGQRQRVAMGRAIVRDPQVFLFDEPLSNLDAKLRVQMRTEIKELHQRLKTTTIFVTHDQVEAMTMADRIVVMHDGRIEQIGAPLELYDTPANLFVAAFIGSPSMNMVDGTVESVGKSVAVKTKFGTLIAGGNHDVAQGQEVVVGFRPEHLELISKASKGSIEAKIAVIEPTGSETHVSLRIEGREVVAVFRERHTFEVGQDVYLMPGADAVHLFDAKSGQRT